MTSKCVDFICIIVYTLCHKVHNIRYIIVLNSIIKQLNFDLHKKEREGYLHENSADKNMVGHSKPNL